MPAATQSYCTSAHIALNTLGREAVRQIIFNELKSFGGILDKHYALLADAMTVTGNVLSVNRTGLKRAGSAGVLGHACFETVVQTIMQAGRESRMDNMKSSSSRLAMGMTPTSGTSIFDTIEECTQRHVHVSEVADFLLEPAPKRQKFSQFMCS